LIKDNVIVVIQVPLERKTKSTAANFFSEAVAFCKTVVTKKKKSSCGETRKKTCTPRGKT